MYGRVASGHIEQLPSGSFRVSVYAGTDPLTGRPLRHRETARTMQQAQILLGRLEQADAGRRPDSRLLVRELLAQYLEITELEPSTRDTYEGYMRRTILPALGSVEVRKVRGPMLDTLYARLRRCADLACAGGRPFTQHNRFPVLSDPGEADASQRWQRSSLLSFGRRSNPESSRQAQRFRRPASWPPGLDSSIAAVRRAIEVLADEGCCGRERADRRP